MSSGCRHFQSGTLAPPMVVGLIRLRTTLRTFGPSVHFTDKLFKCSVQCVDECLNFCEPDVFAIE